MTDPDLLVIGGGAAAISAARSARRFGKTVVMVTDGPPGGDCTFNGCVPSKTLLASAGEPFGDAMARVQHTVAGIAAAESVAVLEHEGIEVVLGRAVFTGPGTVQVDGRSLSSRKLVVATGSSPVVPKLPGLESIDYLTNETMFGLTEAPRHLAVLGGGAIGCEMAQAFRGLGCEVTVLESADRILSKEEPEASEVVHAALTRRGVDLRVTTKVEGVERTASGIKIVTDKGSLEVSHLLVAVGRTPSSAGLEPLGLTLTKQGGVQVDLRMRTSVKNVYAAGDVTGRLPFTHAADEMGRIAATSALTRKPLKFAESAVPWVTFTDPEVARIGLTEAQAAEQHKDARVVELPMSELDRARTSGRTEGFVKLIVGPKPLTRNIGGGRVLGATIVAERAGEMMAEVALVMRCGLLVGRLAQTSHSYPTWSMAVQQAAGQLFGFGDRKPRPARAS